jgi:ornithine carbamoyltransferase
MKRDLLRLVDLTRDDANAVFALATEIKTALRSGKPRPLLAGKTLAMIFEKPSLRTRVSFETGMFQLGGHAIYLAPWDIRLGERETVADVARNLARVVDMIVARTFRHSVLVELAAQSRIPVINGLTDLHHPCQVLADLFTLVEHRRKLDDMKVAFIGDGNNLVHSWMEAAVLFPFTFAVACPTGYEPNTGLVAECQARGAKIEVTTSVADAVRSADVLYNDDVLRHAAKDALVMHCLPAHRGEEITDAVIEGRQSIIFDQAENRLHLQKALMAWLARESSK